MPFGLTVRQTVAVPDVLLRYTPTAVTRSPPCFRPRRRSGRSLPPSPRSVGKATGCHSVILWHKCAKKTNKKTTRLGGLLLAPLVGLEPTTCGLTVN